MDDGGSPIIGLVVLAFLLLINGMIHGFSVALDNLNAKEVEERAKTGDTKAIRLMTLLEGPYQFLHTYQIASVVICVALGAYEVCILGEFFQYLLFGESTSIIAAGLGYLLAAIVFIFILLVLSVFVPQKIAARKSEKWATDLIRPITVLHVILMPAEIVVNLFSDVIVRCFGIDPNETFDDVTEEEIISMVNEGHEQGVILADEVEMIHNIFEFTDKEAQDIMTHRKNMTVLDGEMLFEQAFEEIMDMNYSRFPVYEDDIDNIIGVIHIKDAMVLYKNEKNHILPIKEVANLVRNVSFIPETRNINDLFKKMQSKKVHMVIVVDEYGQTAGLITMEDILEEIVGNILDEHDEEEANIIHQSDGSYLMKGMTDLEDVEEVLDISFEEDDIDTLNGLLISLMDKIPEEGEHIDVSHMGYCFRIVSVENKMIKTVKVFKDEPKPENET